MIVNLGRTVCGNYWIGHDCFGCYYKYQYFYKTGKPCKVRISYESAINFLGGRSFIEKDIAIGSSSLLYRTQSRFRNKRTYCLLKYKK